MCAHSYEFNFKMYHNEYDNVGTYMGGVVCCDQWKWYATSDCKNVRL
jgi:hypothetical protein